MVDVEPRTDMFGMPELSMLHAAGDQTQTTKLAQKLEFDAANEGLSLHDLELKEGDVEAYIRDLIVHVGEPGTPGD